MSQPVVVDAPATGVSRITLNRPEKRNALDIPTRQALYAAIDDALDDTNCRVVILRGADGCFCAGGDVNSMEGQTLPLALARMKAGHQYVRRVAQTEKLFIAAVEGPAAGAGASLALLCDLVIGDASVGMSFPFLRLGLIPDWGLLHTLPARVGWAAARRLLLTAATVEASRCEALGLIDERVEEAQVQDTAVERAAAIASGPSMAYGLLKQGLGLAGPGLDAVLEFEAVAQATCLCGPEFEEGLRAFLEKRPAVFP